ncbi:MAG: rRNA maturation RNase YbeY [Gemmatimonadetes bacterium 21-71-4]|nr:MAG: rRNA maturation RNase YbeY [Gemmatimonadetes bacterium 21-71-4]
MTLQVDVAVGPGRPAIPRALAVEAARTALRARRVRRAELSIAFVSDRTIARLNARHLGHRGPTDVISFGFAPAASGGPLIGDVYVAPGVARRSARERGIPVREELVRLVVHGTLHVLGFDHPDDETRTRSPMWKLQERLVRRVLARSVR